ncbi:MULTISPECIES: nuclear transport factor 2 family protein [Chryseobacterium]|uniref:Ketosteroid isomerase-like protein n=1 Tax=Chryseobacterium camelliae TaxID=1265445 RepID=A0ABU0TEA9_9FLAO|nr:MULTISPECIES: nuclear transport factor 2 family protein [Chryseobacterium]MDT3406793.1 ketosteroid isomerase-like protein [Pseudacidovorax intermedius]MDQ1095411.1 ketosteroid isomerase-like protein [Chryseobacterium camelliae]MDQ1099351.1 ketosteroid isomerase-like protein [Chryseobacterium sp. SORGH_AS_1048]MDR6086697.1 ketosteroid isomerase-like protein [Chryseobacterium sp. SORGH_AS_0909]MDR6131069.1 ketosteroid isomerase-like protein [Chryseobacterium sp. SORGH_AS_1175]
MMTQKDQADMISSYIEAYNNFDTEGMTACLHENVVFENISGGKTGLKTEGIEAFKTQAEAAARYFSSRHQTVDSWAFSDESITISISYEAVPAIDLPNGMKKGSAIILKGESEFVFSDGKIIRITDRS